MAASEFAAKRSVLVDSARQKQVIPQGPPTSHILHIHCLDIRNLWNDWRVKTKALQYVYSARLTRRNDIAGLTSAEGILVYSCLVVFSATPRLAVGVALHDEAQKKRIIDCLDGLKFEDGTALYSALAFCEDNIIAPWVKEWQEKGVDASRARAVLHLYTDGKDKDSDPAVRRRYVQPENASDASMEPTKETLQVRFLYSLGAPFEQSKNLAKGMSAHLKALEERNAHCYRLLGERPKPKIQSGFSYATGTTPIPLLLEKLSFLSTDEKFLSTEGIFRVNADIGRVNAITEMWQKGEVDIPLESLQDPYEIAHALKNTLRSAGSLLTRQDADAILAVNFSSPDALRQMRVQLDKLRDDTRKCLSLLLKLICAVCDRSKVNQMGAPQLSVVFSEIIFPSTDNFVELKTRSDATRFLILNAPQLGILP